MKAKTYLDLVRYSIHPEMDIPDSASAIDWNDFLEFCNRQSIIGLVFEGMDRSKLKIPSAIVFKWFGFAEQIRRKNDIINKNVLAVSRAFEDKGYCSCILKGQANSIMYPKPELRSPGDIDIWVDASDLDIIKMVRKDDPKAHYSLHHIKYTPYKDVSVEVHYTPSHLNNWITDRKLQHYINNEKEKQFSNIIKFGDGEISVLNDEFNAVYQILHMYGHFFSTRNNLKQLIDYYYLFEERFHGRNKAKGSFKI